MVCAISAAAPAAEIALVTLFAAPEFAAEARRYGIGAVVAKEAFSLEVPALLERLRARRRAA